MIHSQPSTLISRGRIYAILSGAFYYPDAERFSFLQARLPAYLRPGVEGLPDDERLQRAAEDLERGLALDLKAHSRVEWEREHARLFSLSAPVRCPPYETEYHVAHVFLKTQRLADVAGFYRAFGLHLKEKDRVDHISAEAEFMSWLYLKEAYALETGQGEKAWTCKEARRKFLEDHLGAWIPAFSAALAAEAVFPFYRSLAGFLARFIELEVCGVVERETVLSCPVSDGGERK